jgi:hypothetical protein
MLALIACESSKITSARLLAAENHQKEEPELIAQKPPQPVRLLLRATRGVAEHQQPPGQSWIVPIFVATANPVVLTLPPDAQQASVRVADVASRMIARPRIGIITVRVGSMFIAPVPSRMGRPSCRVTHLMKVPKGVLAPVRMRVAETTKEPCGSDMLATVKCVPSSGTCPDPSTV